MEKNNLIMVCIVAIVAIVGMLFMTTSMGKTSYTAQSANYVYEDTQGDLAGQATAANIKPVKRDTIPDDDGGSLIEPTTPLIHTRFWRVQKIDELSSPNILNFYTQIFYSSELETYLQGSSLVRACRYVGDDFSQMDQEYEHSYLSTNSIYGTSTDSNSINVNTENFYFYCSFASSSEFGDYFDYSKKQLPVFDEVRFLKDMLTGEYILQVKAHSNEIIDSFSYSFYQGNGGYGIGYPPNSYTIDQEFKINYNETLEASISIDMVTNIKKTDIFYVDLASYIYFKIMPSSKSIESIDGRDYLVYNLESIDVSPTEMEELKSTIKYTYN